MKAAYTVGFTGHRGSLPVVAIRTASQSGLFSRGGSKAANLVNVHIHQFQLGGAVVDAAALAQFQEQWATYRKLVESDCLAHREVSGILRETLNDVFTSPFCVP